MANWWDGLIAPFAPARISGYDFGDKVPPKGWTGTGSDFGWPVHLGTDFGTLAGEPIFSPGPGKVTYKTDVLGYGNELIDQLANGFTFIFGHVASGSSGPAAAGQQIGKTGANIGSSKGAVTLVQILDKSGKPINPDPIIRALPNLGGPGISDPLGVLGNTLPSITNNASIGDAIAGIPTSIGHGLADFFVVGEQDIAAWLQKQAVAFFVAAVVLLVLFL